MSAVWSCQISPDCLSLSVSPFVFNLGLFSAKPCTGDGSECVCLSGNAAWVLIYHKESLMEVDEFCSVW